MITLDSRGVADAAALFGLCRKLDEAAAEHFDEIAVSFEMTNNRDGAAELKRTADWKAAHAEAAALPAPPGILDWYVIDPGDPEALHYLMRPWHVIGLAIENERRMKEFFEAVARDAGATDLRAAAEKLIARQDAHLAELEARRAATPEPEPGWDEDDEPPFFDQ